MFKKLKTKLINFYNRYRVILWMLISASTSGTTSYLLSHYFGDWVSCLIMGFIFSIIWTGIHFYYKGWNKGFDEGCELGLDHLRFMGETVDFFRERYQQTINKPQQDQI